MDYRSAKPLLRYGLAVIAILVNNVLLEAQTLTIGPNDITIDESIEGGFVLTIRKKDSINSVLLTESTRDPQFRGVAYSYYATTPSINSNERRILNGVFIDTENRYYLVDSTPEPHPQFGTAFKIFIPYVVYYGFEDTRWGEVAVHHNTFINIRAFELPFADYRGQYQDNPYVVNVVQGPPNIFSEERFLDGAVDTLREISQTTNGEVFQSVDGSVAVENIGELFSQWAGKSVDLTIVLDTTRSMKNDIDQIKRELPSLLARYNDSFSALNIGLTLYRDYEDEYLVRTPMAYNDINQFNAHLQQVEVGGGRDEPEAVFEALYETLTAFPWSAEERAVVLIADAPPHPRPRGEIDANTVFGLSQQYTSPIHTIVLPR